MGDMDDIVKDFLIESYENLDQLDRDFVALESNPTATDKLGSIFRTIHTIKGTCGCLGMGKLEAVAHVGENLLSRMRNGQLIMDTETASGLLKLVDAIREMLAAIETTGSEGTNDFADVRQLLIKLNERPSNVGGAGVPAVATHAPAAPAKVQIAPSAPPPEVMEADDDTHEEHLSAKSLAVNPHSNIAKMLTESATAVVVAPHIAAPQVAAAPTPRAAAVPTSQAAAAPAPPPAPAQQHDPVHEQAAQPSGDAAGKESVAGNAIRVDVTLLDKLMNLVGELVLARNQVLQYTASPAGVGLQRTAQRLNLITSELQEGVMKTRMQPIGNLWNKFPRIVRDVANACGKKVRIEMDGRETELDKTIIEAIKDPLTHVIRNSVDHGVESPEKRAAAGKPEEGLLFMRAFHEGGQVNIEIKDDGKGIDPEIIKRKALERGLITAEQAARMGEREATNLIFLPGFSTAEKITNVSGRGVGMDVVKTNVERIGGTVDVQSKTGHGTTLRIRIPLTLAIIPALTVTSCGQRFALPQVSLLELVRVEENEPGIEVIQDTHVYRLRGNLLPLVYLNKEFKLKPRQTANPDDDRASNIVVLQAGERQFGLVVDQVDDTEEIVVKPLGKQFTRLNVFAGATIMGDGRVALILDVMGLAQRANVLMHASHGNQAGAAVKLADAVNDDRALLICNLQGGRRTAIPLSMVARLEEFAPNIIEDAGGMSVVQYRGEIMPVINVADVLSGLRSTRARRIRKGTLDQPQQVVVYTHENRNVGLRVEDIIEVVRENINLQPTAARHGVRGTAVIREKVTELLDVDAVVRTGLLATERAKRRAA